MMIARRLSLVVFSLLLLALFRDVEAQSAKKPPMFNSDLSGGDMQFLVAATEQGQTQAALGELAETHAESADVKAFGQTLAKENAIQSEQIKLIAIKKNFVLPENLATQKSPVNSKLEKLQGLKFDKAYILEMLQQEQTYFTIFEKAAQSGDSDIKSFAASALPAIKQHLAFLNHTTGNAAAAPSATPAGKK